MNPARCPACLGCGRVLGTLGALRWYRCRACGVDFSLPRATRSTPGLPSPASLPGQRMVNDRAWRRGTHRAAVTPADAAAAAARNDTLAARPRRKAP
jgi:hypothetical protein